MLQGSSTPRSPNAITTPAFSFAKAASSAPHSVASAVDGDGHGRSLGDGFSDTPTQLSSRRPAGISIRTGEVATGSNDHHHHHHNNTKRLDSLHEGGSKEGSSSSPSSSPSPTSHAAGKEAYPSPESLKVPPVSPRRRRSRTSTPRHNTHRATESNAIEKSMSVSMQTEDSVGVTESVNEDTSLFARDAAFAVGRHKLSRVEALSKDAQELRQVLQYVCACVMYVCVVGRSWVVLFLANGVQCVDMTPVPICQVLCS